MRLLLPFAIPILIILITQDVVAQDENSEDVFDKPLIVVAPRREGQGEEMMMNEGSDTFETSTEMIEIPVNETSLEVNPVEKTSVFSPITQLDGGVFNFSKATIDMVNSGEEEDDDDEDATTITTTLPPPSPTTVTLDVITFSSIDAVADRRVLKEKEEIPTPRAVIPSTQSTSSVSDPSETDEEGDAPFDQSALEGLFEQDGSVIDSSLSTESAPAFPILKMKEEEPKILSNVPEASTTTSTSSVSSDDPTSTSDASSPSTTTSDATSVEITSPLATTELKEESTTSEDVTTTTTSESITSTESKEESTTTEEILAAVPALKNSSKVFLPAKAIRTPITFRITSLDFTEEFNDIQSGPSKKLSKALVPAIGEFINSIGGGEDNLVTVEIKTFTKGSVIVSADVLTKKSLGDAQLAVNLLEAALSRNNSMVSDYTVDTLSVTVDGMTSQAYIDSISTQTSSSYSLSSLMIVIITFALVIIFAVALFIIMMTTKRRRQSTMKLSLDDTIRSITPESQDTPHNVHLMSYGTTPRTTSSSSSSNSPQKPGPITKTQIDETSSPMY